MLVYVSNRFKQKFYNRPEKKRKKRKTTDSPRNHLCRTFLSRTCTITVKFINYLLEKRLRSGSYLHSRGEHHRKKIQFMSSSLQPETSWGETKRRQIISLE